MKPKIKTGISAIMIIGWIFAGLGSDLFNNGNPFSDTVR